MLRTKLVRRAGRLLGAVTVAGVLMAGSAGAASASVDVGANGSAVVYHFVFQAEDANGI